VCFKSYDLDESGELTVEELRAMISGVFTNVYKDSKGAENIVKRVFNNLDKDGNGVLSFDEFMLLPMVEPQLLDCFVIGNLW
jgi:Ca2+-binding EF-hand superfamily protein